MQLSSIVVSNSSGAVAEHCFHFKLQCLAVAVCRCSKLCVTSGAALTQCFQLKLLCLAMLCHAVYSSMLCVQLLESSAADRY
jgi:hypothetical protein